jgi:hypothetical protein
MNIFSIVVWFVSKIVTSVHAYGQDKGCKLFYGLCLLHCCWSAHVSMVDLSVSYRPECFRSLGWEGQCPFLISIPGATVLSRTLASSTHCFPPLIPIRRLQYCVYLRSIIHKSVFYVYIYAHKNHVLLQLAYH